MTRAQRVKAFLSNTVEKVFRIRRPGSVRPGAKAFTSIADAVRYRDLDVWEGDGWPSREWMKNEPANTFVPGSYEDEVFGRRR